MNIIRCDTEEVLKRVPSLEGVLTKYFADNDVLLFACVDNNQLSFLGRCGTYCLYLDGIKELPFGVDKDGKLEFFYKDELHLFPNGFEIFDKDEVCCKDKNGVLHTVISYPMDFGDSSNGAFSYFQFNSEKDVLCEIRYRHYYNKEKDGKSHIYGYYATRNMESIYIDRDYSKHKNFKNGFIPRSFSHYESISFDNDMLGYNFIAISEHGLFNVLTNGAYSLVRERTANRYIKSFYVDKEGCPRELPWPLCKFYKEEEILSELDEFNFRDKVPESLLSIYNGNDEDKLFLDNLISLMNKVIDEKDNTKYMLLRKKAE